MRDFLTYLHCITVGLVALTLVSGCYSKTPPVSKSNESVSNSLANTSQAISPMVFNLARIQLFHLPRDIPKNFAADAATKAFVDPTNPKPIVISDRGSIDKLVTCFPGVGLGLESPNAGGWEACGEVVFIGSDSTKVTVKFDDNFSSWSEGVGDFDIEAPETLRGIILSGSKK